MDPRLADVGRAVEAFVAWARLLDSRRGFPFGDLQLSGTQVEALFLVAHAAAPLPPGRLAEALGVTPGAVTQLVAGLVAADLVEQHRDPADARRRGLVLTGSASARVGEFERTVARRLAPRFDDLDDAELATLADLLSRTTGMP